MFGTDDEDWLEGQLIVVPHAWRGDGLWPDIQSEVQDRIGVALRAIYADALLQPLSPQLAKLVYQIRTQAGTSPHAG